MKKATIVFSCLLILFSAGTVFCEVSNSLIAYYPLDGNTEDGGPSGFDGLEFGVGWSEDGVSSSALSLDGSGGFVDLGNQINFEYDQPFSISLWIKPKAIGKGIIISKREKSRENRGWELSFNKKYQLVFEMCAQRKHNRIKMHTKNAVTDLSSFYHIILTYDGSGFNAGIKIYIDGKNQNTSIKTLNLIQGSILTDAHLNLGAKDNLAYKKQTQFSGLIDELSFYDKALSPEEARSLFDDIYNAGALSDSDGDGVPDEWDQCPDTQPGSPVCSDGCANTTCGGSDDIQPPYDGSISINNGAGVTHSPFVKISVGARDDHGVTGYYISEEEIVPAADDLGWVVAAHVNEFLQTIVYPLSPAEGSKNLFVWFKDSAGNISDVSNSSITLSSFRLPDTGQKLSYTLTLGEDSDYSVNPPSFSIIDKLIVKDNNTKLMWQRIDDQIPRDQTSAVDYCNGLPLGGYSDWRLPDVNELITIIDYGEVAPAINETLFTNTAASFGTFYWTTTVHPTDSDKFFNVDFRYGTINSLNSSSKLNYARCVRGGQNEYSLTDNGNGTITDSVTSLVWEQGSTGPMNWESAISYCQNRPDTNGFGWRLPNFKELETLKDNTKYDPSLDSNYFSDTASHYWSSTTNTSIPTLAYISNYTGTIVSSYAGKMASYYVRCVQTD